MANKIRFNETNGEDRMRRSRSHARKNEPFTFHAASPERWSDIETLFGERGACAGCWCMYWRIARRQYDEGKGPGNKKALRALVRGGHEPGIIAYAADTPAGWCAVAPREDFPTLERSRILKRVDDRSVWSIVCFFVARPFRRQGLSAALLEEAVRFAAERGAQVIEGYPVDPERDYPPTFAFTGLASAFNAAGFSEVARRSPSRPVMRRIVQGAR